MQGNDEINVKCRGKKVFFKNIYMLIIAVQSGLLAKAHTDVYIYMLC